MAHPDERTERSDEKPAERSQADLSARLKQLDDRLDRATGSGRSDDADKASHPMSNQGALGQAFRLSAEFVSGVIAGGALGLIVDKVFGSAPWGLIICLVLGFGAGLLNLARASGAFPGRGQKG
ncbi:AtpZ/AtpI family protein [Chelatococcus sp. SYSU_G07232]|uniref:ATP synthase protein I n=1 Tax=Chelatococcus albus TaxID=3047466 RepID=A0ABT7AEN9_9HYPH|nr:AtpZ/AtpI family protein [Chelatococcus sp. SYSU_G07232]MDJ1157835.1 AtpZ/AtpI family protein [Chelatococcus sp. SYSU_G07232]